MNRQSMKSSNEADRQQLALAARQGEAFAAAIREMTQEEAHGKTKTDGDYLIGVAVEAAEGLYEIADGSLTWREPTNENAHIEVVVCDAADRRFLPGLDVRLTVLDEDGRELGSHAQPFLWHPWLYHYGRNWHIPREGNYTLRVHVEPPRFMRHDKTNGKRYAHAADVEFRGVPIKPAQKRS